MQLVAYGAQDIYLTGNPQITFFKVVYRRHTNFAVEAIEQTFNGTPDFGGRGVVPITRNGDLVTKMYLKTSISADADLSSGDELVGHVGFALIKSVELQIGGTKIDKQYGYWMYMWDQLTRGVDQQGNYDRMIQADNDSGTGSSSLYVPLSFFCCRNDGLALPLIALQYHDVRLEFEFESASNLDTHGRTGDTGLTLSNTTLLVDYIYLDSEERKRFAQASHEYLIEQLQFTGVESVNAGASNNIRLNFNHPVKELVWAVKNSDTTADYFDFDTTSGNNPVVNALLQLNGHDRFSRETGKYFNHVQPWQHHTCSPAVGINVYSFALKPEEHQPSGTCNFSRIDNATLNLTLASDCGSNLYIFAVNYNVLRVMSGMGGVAYSN